MTVMAAQILFTVNCFNRFGIFPEWWEHIEAMVVTPYRDMLDVAVYDDGSSDPNVVQYLCELKRDGRIDWLTLGPDRNSILPLAKHSFANVGYAYSFCGWPEHEFLLHFDTDIWFVYPEKDRGFDWLSACVDRLRDDPRTFSASLWGSLWSQGASYKDDEPPSWFRLSQNDPVWIESRFFSTRMFLVKTEEIDGETNSASLKEVGKPGKTRNNRQGLIGKLDSYERIINKNIIYERDRVVSVLAPESGVVTRHVDRTSHLRWAKKRLGIRSSTAIEKHVTEL